MRKLTPILALVMALALVMVMGGVALGATSVNIAITATGSEVNISCNQTDWAVGTVRVSETIYTSGNLTWGSFTNNGSEAVDIVCHGHNMTGGSGWTMHDTAAGDATFAMQGSITTVGDTEIHTTDYAFITNLLASTSEDFGLVFLAPTTNVGNSAMTMADSGLTFTGSVHV